jgi:Zn finger protein HypA/HybF involved in hydrogenase expression
MQRMNNCEWFCANCLRMIEVLNRHGRCPHCDSNAVDVAYRAQMAQKAPQGDAQPNIVLSINL